MDSTVIASLISSFVAILICLVNNRFTRIQQDKKHEANIMLISYRLEQLEKKVDIHNNVIERTYELERRTSVIEEKQAVANHRIDDLEKLSDDRK